MFLLRPFHLRAAMMAAFASSLLAVASPAAAQYVCPSGPGPGEVQVGMTPGGQGTAPVPLCQEDGSSSGAQLEPWDETVRGMGEAARAMGEQTTADLNRLSDITKEASELVRWRYSAPGQACSATYFSRDGFIRIDGPTGRLKNPTVTFHAPTIAAPRAFQTVDLAFENGPPDGKTVTQAVKGLNWTTGAGEAGFISLHIPTTSALLNAMEDRMIFKLAIAGKTVADLYWNDGNEAKAKLGACFAGAK